MNTFKIKQNDAVDIRCPYCGKETSLNMTDPEEKERLLPIPGISGLYLFQCSCLACFNVKVDFRKFVRRDTNLEGYFMVMSEENDQQPRATCDSDYYGKVNCSIKNLSAGGVGFIPFGSHPIEADLEVLVRFRLDRGARPLLEKRSIIRVAKPSYIGCEFFDIDKHDALIGFYLIK